MIYLTIRTDKPEAEVALYEDGKLLAHEAWQAHRELADTIHGKIKELLDSQKLQLDDLNGIVAYQGPGSFTGLRIGLTVANALAYSYGIPVIATGSDDWVALAFDELKSHLKRQAADLDSGPRYVVPEYGGEAHITQPRK